MTTTTTTTNHRGAVKGTVAAAAGVAVLLGGMGTFALWNAEGAFGDGEMGTGTLEAEFGAIEWKDHTFGTPERIENLAGFLMVPGDLLVGTSQIMVTADGDNLVVEPQIVVDGGVPIESLSENITVELDLAGLPEEGFVPGTTTVTATVTIAFHEDALSGTGEEMGLEFDLSETAINFQQIGPSAAR